MAVFFGMPDDDCVNLLARAMRDWHPALTRLGVRVQIIMAASDNDTPAVKHDGHAALASIRIVSLKDRLTKQFDAEMVVSRTDYEVMSEAGRLAMFDHELSHIDPVRKEKKQRKGYKGPKQYYVPLDDLGRPKLKLKLGDWSAGDGFRAVVARHGDSAIEFENLRRAYEFARRARDEGPQDDDQGGEITGTVDRDDIGTQLTFDDVYQELTDAVADLADKGVTVEVRPAAARREPTEDAVRERLADICDQIPVIAENPVPAYEVGGPREEAAVIYDKITAAEPAAVPTWRKMPLSGTGWEDSIDPDLWVAISRKCFFAGELADELLKGETFGALLTDVEVVLTLVEQISADDETPIKFENEEAAESLLGASDAEPSRSIVRCEKCKATYDAAGRDRCPSCGKPLPKSEPEPAPAAATKLADLVGFHDAVGDALLVKGITTVETLLERLAEYRAKVGLDDLPLRNQLVTYFVADLGGVKLKPCEWAADAVAKHLEPKPEQPKSHSVADTGIALVIRIENADNVVKKLTKEGVRTIGELCAWVDRVAAEDGGIGDPNGTGIYSALKGIKVGKDASRAGDAVLSFLRAHNLVAKPEKHVEPKPKPPGYDPAGPVKLDTPLIDLLAGADVSKAGRALDEWHPGVPTVETLLGRCPSAARDASFTSKLFSYLRDMPGLGSTAAHQIGDALVDAGFVTFGGPVRYPARPANPEPEATPAKPAKKAAGKKRKGAVGK